MKWKEIDGWFDDGDADMYWQILQRIPEGGNFLEIGCYKGRSTAFMASIIQELKKDVKIHVVDTFQGDEDTGKGDIYADFMGNMKEYLPMLASVRKGLSVHMAEDNTDMFDAIYIDASHTYQDVLADIDAWLPHLRLGGCIGGHDYTWSEVHRAVNDRFTEVITVGNSWLVYNA